MRLCALLAIIGVLTHRDRAAAEEPYQLPYDLHRKQLLALRRYHTYGVRDPELMRMTPLATVPVAASPVAGAPVGASELPETPQAQRLAVGGEAMQGASAGGAGGGGPAEAVIGALTGAAMAQRRMDIGKPTEYSVALEQQRLAAERSHFPTFWVIFFVVLGVALCSLCTAIVAAAWKGDGRHDEDVSEPLKELRQHPMMYTGV